MSGSLDGAIGALLLLGLLLLWWHSAVQARERARQLARQYCERQDWQLLDQTVALSSLRPVRHIDRWFWRRRYRFDFSPDGGQRRRGELLMLGNRLERVIAEIDDDKQLID
jgi:hypothetical protein